MHSIVCFRSFKVAPFAQAQVNEAPILEDVLQMFHHFCKDHGLAPAKEVAPQNTPGLLAQPISG